jgi:hypothetical protein
MKTMVTSGTALRIIKNETLLCQNCLSSGPGPNEESVQCFLNPETKVKYKTQFCPQGLWIINGQVMGFKEGFQKVYTDDPSLGNDKEIKV